MPKRFDAFISYSRADEATAAALQLTLKRLMRRPFRRQRLRVFRDLTSSRPGGSLAAGLAQALADSEWIIVLLSQHSAQSQWVGEEIRTWAKLGPDAESRMLLVRCDDSVELRWEGGKPLAPQTWPPALVEVLSSEQSYVDVTERLPGWDKTAAIKLAASIEETTPDQISGEDLKQHRRMRVIGIAAIVLVVALAVTALAFGIAARSNASTAERNAARARANESLAVENQTRAEQNEARAVNSALVATAEQMLQSDPAAALGLALAAHERDPSTDALAVARRALESLPPAMWFGRIAPDVQAVRSSPDGQLLAARYADRLQLLDSRTLAVIAESTDVDERWNEFEFIDNRTIIQTSDDHARLFAAADGRFVSSVTASPAAPGGHVLAMRVTVDDGLQVLWQSGEVGSGTGGAVYVDRWTLGDGFVEVTTRNSLGDYSEAETGALSSAGHYAVVASGFKLAGTDVRSRVYALYDDAPVPFLDLQPNLRPTSVVAVESFCYAGEGVPDKFCGFLDVTFGGEPYGTGDRSGQVETHHSQYLGDSSVTFSNNLADGVQDLVACGGAVGLQTRSGVAFVSPISTLDTYPGASENDILGVTCVGDDGWVVVSDDGHLRFGSRLRESYSGRSNAYSVRFDGPGVGDGSIGTPADIRLEGAGDGSLLLLSGDAVIASAPYPAGGFVASGESVTPIAFAEQLDSELTAGDRQFGFAFTFGAGAQIGVDDVSAPDAPIRLLSVELIDEQPLRTGFMSDDSLFMYGSSVNGEYIEPLWYQYSDAATVRIACAIGATIPSETVADLDIAGGRPVLCAPSPTG